MVKPLKTRRYRDIFGRGRNAKIERAANPPRMDWAKGVGVAEAMELTAFVNQLEPGPYCLRHKAEVGYGGPEPRRQNGNSRLNR